MIRKHKKGKSAIDQVRSTISRILKDIVEDDNIKKKLTYYICRDLGLICKHMDTDGDWTTGCRRPPKGRGLCMKHYQNKYCRRHVPIRYTKSNKRIKRENEIFK